MPILQRSERIKVAENFYLDEFIPPCLYMRHKDNIEYLMSMVDPRMFKIAHALRNNLKTPITINNWATGGNREWSGVRVLGSPYYSKNSRHSVWFEDCRVVKRCDAIDCLLGNTTASNARLHIQHNYKSVYKALGVSRVEANVNWLHVDCKPTNSDDLTYFKN